jgi:hypothetical protein
VVVVSVPVCWALVWVGCLVSSRLARRRDAFGDLGDAGDREAGLVPLTEELEAVFDFRALWSWWW